MEEHLVQTKDDDAVCVAQKQHLPAGDRLPVCAAADSRTCYQCIRAHLQQVHR